MNVWLGLLLGASAITVAVLTLWWRRVQTAELGSVSAQWLSEHRGYDRHYSER